MASINPQRQTFGTNAVDPYARWRATEHAHALTVFACGQVDKIDQQLADFCVAWQNIERETWLPAKPRAAWRHIHACTSVSGETYAQALPLMEALSLPFEDVRILWRKLVTARLIYPDGSLSRSVTKLLTRYASQVQLGF